MVRYHFRAVDAQGQVHCGYEMAANRGAMESRLVGDAMTVLSLQADKQAVPEFLQRSRKRHRAHKVLPALLWQASQLLAAGVPMLSVLDALCDTEQHGPLSGVFRDVRLRVSEGCSLSEACGFHPEVFSASIVASLAIAEADGSLADALSRAEQDLVWQQKQWRQLKATLSYPLFASGVVLVVICFLLLAVVPELGGVLLQQSSLSSQTVWLFSISRWLDAHAFIALGVISTCALLICALVTYSYRCQRWFHRLVLRLPSFGPTVGQLVLARYCRTVGRLYLGGTELIEALHLGESQVSNHEIRDCLIQARVEVLQGTPLSDALSDLPTLPITARYQLVAGEQSGALGTALERIANQLASAADFRLQRLRQLINPLVMCLVGGLLVWVIVAVLLPIYDTMLTMEGAL